jgi:hypothetical protein
MVAEYTVQDDFLPLDLFHSIKSVFLGSGFPWYISDNIIGNREEDPLYGYQFTHMLYADKTPQSNFYQVILPMIEVLNPSALVKIKANLTPVRSMHYEPGMHKDVGNFGGYTSVYYINSNNGYTKFNDGTTVNSVENRLVTFKSSQIHTAGACTDQRYRCVLNLNYYKWSDDK